MTIAEFRQLEDIIKEKAIWENGNFMANFDDNDKKCDLYELDGFFVSFSYEMHKNSPAKITAASYRSELTPTSV